MLDNVTELIAMATTAHAIPGEQKPVALMSRAYEPAKHKLPDNAILRWLLADKGAIQLPVILWRTPCLRFCLSPRSKTAMPPPMQSMLLSACQHIRSLRSFADAAWSNIKLNPVQILVSTLPATVEVRTSAWRESTADGLAQLAGYAKFARIISQRNF